MWILILHFVSSQAMTVNYIEFSSKEKCEKAATEMGKSWNMYGKVKCFEK